MDFTNATENAHKRNGDRKKQKETSKQTNKQLLI